MKRLTIILFLVFVALTMVITEPSSVLGANGESKDVKAGKGDVAASSDQYIIGPEDVLDVFVWKEEQMTKTVPVRIDGMISLPLVNDIQAAGLTPLQLQEVIVDKLKGFVDHPTVTVTVREANSYKIYVSGEVRTPGVMRIRSETTLVKAIISAGGFTEWANKRKILIISTENGKEKRTWANYNKIVDGDVPDIIIKRGDTIIVK